MKIFLKQFLYLVPFVCLFQGCQFLDIDFEGDTALLVKVIDQKFDSYPEVAPIHISQEIKSLVDRAVQGEDERELRLRKLLALLYNSDGLALRYSPEVTHFGGITQS